MDERRAIKILSALFFPSDPEGKLGDRDCVWHGEKKKTRPKIYLISIRETYFEGRIKTKEPLALWDLSRAESRTFRPFEDKTLA